MQYFKKSACFHFLKKKKIKILLLFFDWGGVNFAKQIVQFLTLSVWIAEI